MRNTTLSLAIATTLCVSFSLPAMADDEQLAPNKGRKPVTDAQQFAYSIGYMNGRSSLEQIPDLDVETFLRAFRDAYTSKQSLLTADESASAINRYKQQRLVLLEAEMEKLARENAAIGAEFLKRNAQNEGVVTTASGLQYRVITEGKGRKPVATDMVRVNYEGAFIDGSVFDSSYSRNEPAVFQLDSVIAGWTEGLQLMNVGAVYEFFVPAEMAYGEAGAGPIPPNSVLQFRIEMLGIERPPARRR